MCCLPIARQGFKKSIFLKETVFDYCQCCLWRTNFCRAKHYRYLDLTLDHEPSRKLFTLKYQRIEIMALLFLMQKDLEEL